jgi:ectoine hydroxylase-related dioxygenase (phytanoyl-CoA dioxygenase family)
MSSAIRADAEGFHAFHQTSLPQRIAAGNGALAWKDLQDLGTLGLRTPAGAYTYLPNEGTVEIIEGDDRADTVIELDLQSFVGLASDLDTAPGLFYGGQAVVSAGKPGRFIRWEPGLRALYHGRPIFDPETADLRSHDGTALDPTMTFPFTELEDRRAEARHFMDEAGYLVVSRVFAPEEVATFLDEVKGLEAGAFPADGQSWWGRNTSGQEILTRVLNAGDREPLRALYAHPRVLGIVSVAPGALACRESEGKDAVTVLWKRAEMVEGLSDLPWHRDCGMGGHALNCPTAIMTICLTEGSAEAGELRVLPGSHRGSFPFVDGRDASAPEGIHVDVRAGDVSLHYSDVGHVSMAPTSPDGPERISVLLAFVPPEAGHHRGGRHYNDVLLGSEDGQVENLSHKMGSNTP